jgi:PPOX class probable F420-dependent enzyme
MHKMTRAEWWDFAMHGTRTGKLATVRADGRAHVAPIWFLLEQRDDHDLIVFNTGAESVKGKALRRDPRFSMCVDSEEPPFSFVLFDGEATISTDLDEMLHWSTRIAARYMGEDRAEAYGRRNAVEGELLVYGRITKVAAYADIAG